MTPWHADYNDLQSHLPIPEPRSLLDYRLANGLRQTNFDRNSRVCGQSGAESAYVQAATNALVAARSPSACPGPMRYHQR